MVDATPSATPIPAQPVATVTNPAAPFPPADPLPVFVPPSVTDPVSNLDFLPVDDAFALEFRSETIEQLAGGDALRRGESERIEAGRSATNADLVAGRDRVRVHATLREHTGHGLTEQAAHLHTTVEGTLEVHAASEDTVLLAGHMRELWDGGGAIVAAMTDDTVGGGGIRVTTPLDLWVHGLMGVEERIGTCTADAVLMELGATHYEREYGPGAHAAGLAVYTGSLYQSSRSTFRPLMRVKSGVRNLIAGGGGGGGGGDAGAGSAPGASPPPVPTGTGAAEVPATATLAAGRSAAQAPASALDTADALTGARQVPLEELVHSVDARAGEEMGVAGIVMRAEDLPELTRSSDTAERLGALRETLRIDAPKAASEAAGGFRASELDGAGSMHRASGALGALEIEPPSTVYGENARMVCPHPGNPRGERPELELGLPGGADRPPQPAAPESDFYTVERKLRDLQNYYRLANEDIGYDCKIAVARICGFALRRFTKFGGKTRDLPRHQRDVTQTAVAYRYLEKTASEAEQIRDFDHANRIREALDDIYKRAIGTLQALCAKHEIAEVPPTQTTLPPQMTVGATVTVAALPPPGDIVTRLDWIAAYRQLLELDRHFLAIGHDSAHLDFSEAASRISRAVRLRFKNLAANPGHLFPPLTGVTQAELAEQAFRAIEDAFNQATTSGEVMRARAIQNTLESLDKFSIWMLGNLTEKYGALEVVSTRTMQAPPVTGTPPVAAPRTTVPPVERLHFSVPAHPINRADNPEFSEPAVGLVHTTGVPGRPPASGLPEPSLAAASGAAAGDLGRGWFDPPATVSGTTAAEPVAIEAIVTPSLGGTTSFWLQPAGPWPAALGSVPFDSGPHHTGETVQPPPVTAAPGSTAPALSRTASATGLAEHDLMEIDRLLGTGEGASHPAPLPPPPAAGRAGVDAGAPPPAADPWGIRPQGMGSEPHFVAFAPWTAPPGPSSQVVYTEAIRTPVRSAGSPPGWQGAETLGFARATSGAVEVPFPRREEIARRFGTEDALFEAQYALQTGDSDALGWSAVQWPGVLADLHWLRANFRSGSAAAAARVDIDWSALEALARFLEVRPPLP